MNYVHFSHCFLILDASYVCSYAHMARMHEPPHTHTHMQAGGHVCQISPFDVAPPGAVQFVLWVSFTHWHRDEAGLAGQPTPELYCLCHQHTSSHPFFISSSFVLFVGSGDGFQILMVVQQALYQPNCFPSSQWPVFQLHYLAWLWWLRIFIRLSPSHFA